MHFSVIVPIRDEQETVVPLAQELERVMHGLKQPYEILFIDDGSQDRGPERLRGLQSQQSFLQIISLGEHQGKSKAFQAGLDLAQGEIIITLDGDLQDDPRDIPKLLRKIEEGYDMVVGWRKDRRDCLSKKIASQIANFIRRIVVKEKIHDVGCGLKVFKKHVLKGIRLIRGRHRFLSAIAVRRGYRVSEVIVMHHARTAGHSKYGFCDRLTEGAIDLCWFCTSDLK